MSRTDELRALKIIYEENAHDCLERPLQMVNHLIENGSVEVLRTYRAKWGGRYHACREVSITQGGISELKGAGKI